jgi:hypothetical protein
LILNSGNIGRVELLEVAMIFAQLLRIKFISEIVSRIIFCVVCFFPASAGAISNSIDLQELYSSTSPDSQTDPLQFEGVPETNHNVWIVLPDGGGLRGVLADWTRSADWHLHWGDAGEIQIEQGAVFEGDFAMAVHNMISTLAADSVFAITDTENRTVTIYPIGCN